jgi:uncharacterized membrane protein
MIAAGVVSGALAAVFGWIDWFGIPANTRAKRVGLTHGVGNAIVLVLFAGAWLIRYNLGEHRWSPRWSFVLMLLGAGLALFTAWLGGELVDRLGVGVHDGAHLDAPSSLSGRATGAERTAGTRG